MHSPPLALTVVTGAALMYALADHRAQFYRLVMRAGAVLCCRVSPDQKAEVVRLVKEHDPALVTLAIGVDLPGLWLRVGWAFDV